MDPFPMLLWHLFLVWVPCVSAEHPAARPTSDSVVTDDTAARLAETPASHIVQGHPKPGSAYFFSIGDFGVSGCETGYLNGDFEDEGGIGHRHCKSKHQHVVAQEMERLAAGLKPRFIASLGDNFYIRGISNVDDPQINETFEHVYGGSLATIPWKISLGDHDHRGNVSAMLMYSQRSIRWEFPAPYYEFEVPVPGTTGHIQVVVTDSIGLEGGVSPDVSSTRRFLEDYTEEFAGADAAAKQWEWLENTLGLGSSVGSTPVFRLVIGHRPVFSTVNRGRTSAEREVEFRLRDLLVRARETAPVMFMNGHDHAMQVFVEDERLHYVVNGVGGMVHHPFKSEGVRGINHLTWARSELYGFVVHEVKADSMVLHFVDAGTKEVVHSHEVALSGPVVELEL